jgi:hypothetical protein
LLEAIELQIFKQRTNVTQKPETKNNQQYQKEILGGDLDVTHL